MINKKVINITRLQQLMVIEEVGEADTNLIAQICGKSTAQINLSLERFLEYGFVEMVNYPLYQLSESGKEYLAQIRNATMKPYKRLVTSYDREHYHKMIELLRDWNQNEAISPSTIQRRIRVGYGTAIRILHELVQENIVEVRKTWIGSFINGKMSDGYYIQHFYLKHTCS